MRPSDEPEGSRFRHRGSYHGLQDEMDTPNRPGARSEYPLNHVFQQPLPTTPSPYPSGSVGFRSPHSTSRVDRSATVELTGDASSTPSAVRDDSNATVQTNVESRSALASARDDSKATVQSSVDSNSTLASAQTDSLVTIESTASPSTTVVSTQTDPDSFDRLKVQHKKHTLKMTNMSREMKTLRQDNLKLEDQKLELENKLISQAKKHDENIKKAVLAERSRIARDLIDLSENRKVLAEERILFEEDRVENFRQREELAIWGSNLELQRQTLEDFALDNLDIDPEIINSMVSASFKAGQEVAKANNNAEVQKARTELSGRNRAQKAAEEHVEALSELLKRLSAKPEEWRQWTDEQHQKAQRAQKATASGTNSPSKFKEHAKTGASQAISAYSKLKPNVSTVCQTVVALPPRAHLSSNQETQIRVNDAYEQGFLEGYHEAVVDSIGTQMKDSESGIPPASQSLFSHLDNAVLRTELRHPARRAMRLGASVARASLKQHNRSFVTDKSVADLEPPPECTLSPFQKTWFQAIKAGCIGVMRNNK